MRGEGFTIIPIMHDHQLAYACNVLNLGKGRIISVHAPSARQIVKSHEFQGDVQVSGTLLCSGLPGDSYLRCALQQMLSLLGAVLCEVPA